MRVAEREIVVSFRGLVALPADARERKTAIEAVKAARLKSSENFARKRPRTWRENV
jgi:hypothetical protein